MESGETEPRTDETELRNAELAEETTADDGDRALSTEDLVQAEPESTGTNAVSSTEDSNTTFSSTEGSNTVADEDEHVLFDDADVERFNTSWQGIQTAFVDDPQRAVKEADELVAVVIQTLAATFAEHKSELESAWSQGEPATEDLRIALRRYRSFFKQLLRS